VGKVTGDSQLQSEVLEDLSDARAYRRWLADLARPHLGPDPLEIGSGTGDYALEWVPDVTSFTCTEADQSRRRIEEELGHAPSVFAYPYGDTTSAGPRDFDLMREAGFAAAVTTRKGLIFPAHKDHLTALPRLSLNGSYQKLRYIDVLLSGAAFALSNGFRRVRAA